MNIKSFEKTDRKILTIAASLFLMSSLLLWQNDWIYRVVQVQKGNLEQIGEVRMSNNDVRRRFEVAMAWLPLKGNNKVYQGDSIFTGDNSTAVIITKNGEEISIAPNSLVVITQKKDSLSLNIGFGSVKGKVEKGKKFFVASNDKLTEFAGDNAVVNIDAGEGNKLLLNVISGQVNLKTKEGDTILRTQETTEIKDDGSAKDVIASRVQIVNPSPGEHFKFKEDTPIIFRWKTAKTYTRMKIKVATDEEFHNVVIDSRIDDNSYSAYNLPKDEILYWQVVAEGGQSEINKFTLAGDIPPFPTFPKPGFQFYYDPFLQPNLAGSHVDVTWEQGSIASTFEVQLATDFNFKTNVKSYKTDKHTVSLGLLTAGQYYWRVRSNDFIDEKWSEPSHFKVGPEPTKILSAPVPELADNTFLIPTKIHGESTDKIHSLRRHGAQKYIEQFPKINWSPVNNAELYVLQISRNSTFTNIIVNETQPQRSYVWRDIEPGEYFWRIKGVSEAYRDGRYTRTQKIVLSVAPPQALTQPLIVDEIPDPILLNAPPPPMTLKWNPTLFTEEYEIEFSANSEFKDSKKFITSKSEKQILIPKPGIYFWRVRSLDRFHVPVSPISSTYTLEFQRVYKDPAISGNLIALHPKSLDSIVIVGTKKSELEFKWNRPFKDVRYRVELSYDPQFEKVFYSAQTDRHYFKYTQPFKKKIIYWRVRAENDKFISAWTDTSRFYVSYENKSFDFEKSDDVFKSRIKAQERQNQLLAAQQRRLNILRSPASKLQIRLDTPVFTSAPQEYTIKSNIDSRIDPLRLSQQPMTKFYDQVLGNPTFEWQKVPAAEKYIFEIARDEEFQQIITKLPSYNPTFTWDKAHPGRYFYRVQAFNERYAQSLYSDVKKIDIAVTAPYTVSEDTVVEVFDEPKELWQPPKPFLLKWMPVVFARAYEVEFSEHKNFEKAKVYKSRVTDVSIRVWSTGLYYWRVRALNENGIAIGPFSSIRSVEVSQTRRTLASIEPLKGIFPVERTMLFVGEGLMNVVFYWKNKVAQEVVEVSDRADFSNIISKVIGRNGKALVSNDLPEGKLYWRVSSSNVSTAPNEFYLKRERLPYSQQQSNRR